jgi:hypothetical protein
MANLSFAISDEMNSSLTIPCYKPIPDVSTSYDNEGKVNDSLQYRKWCEKTFDNGKYIYDAYKNVAFNIKYTPESNNVDFWQTPIETTTLKKGDCEDAVFNYFSQIPSNMKNAEIVWGWVFNKRTKVEFAHVWYQLTDKKGLQYVVEGYSNDWNGIIPMEIIQDIETRKPIFIISHRMLNKLSRLLPEVKDWKMCLALVELFAQTNFVTYVSGRQPFSINIQRHFSSQEYVEYPDRSWEYIQHTNYSRKLKMVPGVSKEISNILEKLQELFFRHEGQKREIENIRVW